MKQNQRHDLPSYVARDMKRPLLTRERETILLQGWKQQHDKRALQELMASFTRLVVSVAYKYRRYGLPLSDLIQEGQLAVMHALDKFDLSRNLRFSTYVTWWVRAQVQDYILKNWSIVRSGSTAAHKALFFNFRRLRSKLEMVDSASQAPSANAALAHELGVAVSDLSTYTARLRLSDQSLNAPLNDEHEDESQDWLVDDGPSPYQITAQQEAQRNQRRYVQAALRRLPQRERTIVRQRCLNTDATLTLEELGRSMGVSKERIRQLEARAMARLKNYLTARIPQPHDLIHAA